MVLVRRVVMGLVAASLVASLLLAVWAFAPSKAYAGHCTPWYWCGSWEFVGGVCGCDVCKESRQWHRLCARMHHDCWYEQWLENKWTCDYYQPCCP